MLLYSPTYTPIMFSYDYFYSGYECRDEVPVYPPDHGTDVIDPEGKGTLDDCQHHDVVSQSDSGTRTAVRGSISGICVFRTTYSPYSYIPVVS